MYYCKGKDGKENNPIWEKIASIGRVNSVNKFGAMSLVVAVVEECEKLTSDRSVARLWSETRFRF